MNDQVKPDCFGEYPLNAGHYAEKYCGDCSFEETCYDKMYGVMIQDVVFPRGGQVRIRSNLVIGVDYSRENDASAIVVRKGNEIIYSTNGTNSEVSYAYGWFRGFQAACAMVRRDGEGSSVSQMIADKGADELEDRVMRAWRGQ